MRRLPEIVSTYEKLDKVLEDQRAGGRPAAHVESQQIINDQAYFLLCWGQLESEIDARCWKAIRQGRSLSTWERRRSWDLYNPDDRRLSGLSFEDRTALVLDRGGGRGSPYAKAITNYATRNQIAHGQLQTTRIDVIAIAQDFYLIQSALTPDADR